MAAITPTPNIDPDVGCLIPPPGAWPADPQTDQPLLETRIWVDGCFDFFHHGHAGVMLQSRRLGTELYVGLHSDEDIAANKGPTVMNLAERQAAVDACRFSTKCVPHAPYVTSIPWISHYGCMYVSHGDDITSDASGEDCYRFVKRAGRMKIVPRTPGISTTDLVGRMLLCTREHHIRDLREVVVRREGEEEEKERGEVGRQMKRRLEEYAAAPDGKEAWVQVYSFQPTHWSVERRRKSSGVDGGESSDLSRAEHGQGTFTSVVKGLAPRPDQRLVYVDGGFDLFSSGHIAFLQTVVSLENDHGKARGWFTDTARTQRIRATGTDYSPAYIVAGVHDDDVINFHKGLNYPIMNIFERGLCVVQCAYIHGVVFGAPFIPSRSYLSALPFGNRVPDVVYHGPTSAMPSVVPGLPDPYTDAKALGVFVETPAHDFQDVSSEQIVRRILDNRAQYEERQRKKGMKVAGEEAQRRVELEAERKKRIERKRRESINEVERQFGA